MDKSRLFGRLCAGIGFMLACAASQAQTVAIDPVSVAAPTGDTIGISITGSDFEMVDGAFDLSWDASVLSYNGDFAFAAGLTERDAFFDTIDYVAPGLLTIGWTTGFGPAMVFGATPRAIGSLSFTLIGDPGSVSPLTLSDNLFLSFLDGSFSPIAMNYVNGSAAVNPVPVPAALWLFASGALGLAGVARRRRLA
ncbi:MAG: hypothetical protein R3F42_14230 [Pseudomonadota bacterium]